MTDPYVIGLDLSLQSSGIAAVDGSVHTFEPKSKGMERIEAIRAHVMDFVVPHVELAVVEGYSFGSKGQTHATGEMGGVVRHALYMAGVAYIDVPPNTVKKYATGNGNAGKFAMIKAADKRLGYDGESDDEADALWLRAIGWELLEVPVCYLPELNRSALHVLRATRPEFALKEEPS